MKAHITIDDDLAEKLASRAKADERSQAWIVRKALSEYLGRTRKPTISEILRPVSVIPALEARAEQLADAGLISEQTRQEKIAAAQRLIASKQRGKRG